MAVKEPKAETPCTTCGLLCEEDALQVCMICRRLFCQRCAVADYGRQFCSAHCRDLFFYGDDDDYDS